MENTVNRSYRAKTGNGQVENLGVGFDDGAVFKTPKKIIAKTLKGENAKNRVPFHNDLYRFYLDLSQKGRLKPSLQFAESEGSQLPGSVIYDSSRLKWY
jgi:hypothetical protein